MTKRSAILLGLFLVALGIPLNLEAQVAGTISGYVRDESGAVMPGVDVRATMVGQQTTRSAVTDETGFFNLLAMPRGAYEITAQLTGFTTQQTKAELTAGENLRVDFKMSLGQLSETVVVAGTTALIETRSATMSGLVDDRRVQELPLNGRNVVELASTLPGITDVHGVRGDGQHTRRADDDRARRLSRSEQLHAERRELHQLLADRRVQSAAAGRGAGNPRADVDVLGRVRQQRRRAGDDGHQGRQQPVPWVGVGVHSQRRAQRAELLRASKVGSIAEPVGRGCSAAGSCRTSCSFSVPIRN